MSKTPGADRASTRVADIMTTNLFTVRPEDLVDLATSMMEWKHVRHVPVESSDGELVGLLATRELLRLRDDAQAGAPLSVAGIMQADPPTIGVDATLQDALSQMLETEAGCLLVVSGKQLIGIVTERDLLAAAAEQIF